MRRTLGLLAIGCFAVHAAGCGYRGVWGDALWACHVAVAVMGAGLLLDWPRLAGAGAIWILLGTPLWFVDVVCGAEFVPTSLATHGGGFVIAFLNVRATGLPRGSWWRAWLGGALLQQLSRWVTAPERNINAAFEVYDRFASVLNSYEKYLLALGVISAACLWCGEKLLHALLASVSRKGSNEEPS